jgi:hypothetical protein
MVVACRLDWRLASGRHSPGSWEIDLAFGIFVAVAQTLPGASVARVLDRILVVAETPQDALVLIGEVRSRLKEACASKPMRERYTVRALLHCERIGRGDVGNLAEGIKMLVCDIVDLVRPGTLAVTPDAWDLFNDVDRSRWEIEAARQLSGRSGSLIVHALNQRRE